jgi:hypothetical protein
MFCMGIGWAYALRKGVGNFNLGVKKKSSHFDPPKYVPHTVPVVLSSDPEHWMFSTDFRLAYFR